MEARRVSCEHSCVCMVDRLDTRTRSRVMSKVHGKDTQPEMVVRRGLHGLGFRYLLHCEALPGKPDLVFPKYRAIILINGCFWHKHDCHRFIWPTARRNFWRRKIESNVSRDRDNLKYYADHNWKVLQIWECSIVGAKRRKTSEVVNTAANWLRFDEQDAEIECR